MTPKLYPHQAKALGRLTDGKILCGGTGSGKSITALAWYFKENNGYSSGDRRMVNPKDLYIITTAMKRDSHEWELELGNFELSTESKRSSYSNKVVVDSWNNIAKYIDVTDSFFIFDEQRVVGYGKWSKTFIKIAKRNRWILLSATPGDTWSDYIPVFIANGYYRNKTDFEQQHVIFDCYRSYKSIKGYVVEDKLKRLRNDILIDMPVERSTVHHDKVVKVGYDKKTYRDIFVRRVNPYTEEPITSASNLCYLLRQVCNSDKSRIDAVRDILKEHPKCILFYNFDYELELLHNEFDCCNMDISEWNGHKHEPVPTSGNWLYLVQYTAGAEGWNCITTDTVIFFSQTYSYRATKQAEGRIDRMNTPFVDLYYYYLRSSSSIDLGIARAMSRKHDFNMRGFTDGYYSK